MYQIEITNTAHHHLRKLSPINRQRVHEAIEQLSQNPNDSYYSPGRYFDYENDQVRFNDRDFPAQ